MQPTAAVCGTCGGEFAVCRDECGQVFDVNGECVDCATYVDWRISDEPTEAML